MLVLESFWVHITDCVKKEVGNAMCDLVIILGGTTLILQRRLVLKRAWNLQLAVFPGPNPLMALYVPQDVMAKGSVASLLNFIGHVFYTCDGFDNLVASPLKPAQQIPDYWKPQPDLWLSYHILQAAATPRYVFMKFPTL